MIKLLLLLFIGAAWAEVASPPAPPTKCPDGYSLKTISGRVFCVRDGHSTEGIGYQ